MNLLNSRWQATIDLAQQYHQAQPFPYVVMDDFLDSKILEVVRSELQAHQDWYTDKTEYSSQGQRNKWFTPSPDSYELTQSLAALQQQSPVTMSVLRWLKSPEFLIWLEAVTNISDIQIDDDWLGGGVHRVGAGGVLDVHADFNIHWKNNLHRRLNLLIYLNPGWQREWGGALELWDTKLTRCCHRILPIFNRAVLFRITDDAFHGHPDPVRHPQDQDRLSLAMYYYTQDRPNQEKAPFHGVIWQGKVDT
jgi:Rps23 Pro-64 3,4-dihydroxylase Tpa1-like proline 4-hydroxylase